MCGIVGYLGKRPVTDVLVNGLSNLQYRGYDSAGVAVVNENCISIVKKEGKLENLESALESTPVSGCVGIAHTRWATHGKPSDINSHPHYNADKTIAVVHNGIIENYKELKAFLAEKGYEFYSDTDTEVIPKLIDYLYEDNIETAVMKATDMLKGSYALGVVSSKDNNKLVGVRKQSPLIVGIGENENFIASDIPAILDYTTDVYLLDDNEFVIITDEGIKIVDRNNNVIEKAIYKVDWKKENVSKGNYEHYMLKEIHEQPEVTKNTLDSVIDQNTGFFRKITFDKEMLSNINRIYLVGCGTAYHAGLSGKMAIETLARIPVETDVASEFRYRNPIVDSNTLVIVISQSGETADTLEAVRKWKGKAAAVIGITNVIGSSVSRECDKVFYTRAGAEISVASTKAYVAQLTLLYLVAIEMAYTKGILTEEESKEYISKLYQLPKSIETILDSEDRIAALAEELKDEQSLIFLGRDYDYPVALEGALKVKEITYINCTGYAAGELKHGPIALVEKGTKIIAVCGSMRIEEKTHSNLREVMTRGAEIYCVSSTEHKEFTNIVISETIDLFTPILTVVPLQLLSYYIAKHKGLNVDMPRNLAKSVTVE
ncbi:Glutamine-fructose-6-phosphate aminotransferase [Clostridium bornimense]|uniref:Glutamine--fructose-6-phosphate aminotransferase [isomerizing] n=1 Tax=Clostridium bornimense TaxID=1216932 RepID=W6RUZ0_9CLOT|nr:glutamine--fructose-6-phosphate transaminase (isomerizing) [Clostridium bornimense]CDM68486.1 Glutamine-fructose-6-phosphate aminotransferase [Clostridium bornimense]